MSIYLAELCSNMITSRGWMFCFSSPSFLYSLFCWELIYSSFFLLNNRTIYLKHLNIFYSRLYVEYAVCQTQSCLQRKAAPGHYVLETIAFHKNICSEKDQTLQNGTSLDKLLWKEDEWARRCYYPL